MFHLNRICNKLALILAGLILILLQQNAEAAAGVFIHAPSRVDMVYDSSRDIVYITNENSVLRYKIGSNTFLSPFNLGGSLSGIDLSPDGNTLVIADGQHSATENWIYLVDLKTDLSRKVSFPLSSGEGGIFTTVFGNDGKILVSSKYEGSGSVPLRLYAPATGATTQIASMVDQDTMLTSSGDGSVIGLAESNSSDGPFDRYRVQDGNFLRKSGYTDGTSAFNYEIGVNHNGTQYAIPTYEGTLIYDADLKRVNAIAPIGQYAGPQPIGVVYHPVEDIVFFSWAESTEVRSFETTAFTKLSAYGFESITTPFTSNGNSAFVNGRLKTSRDGSLLIATVTGGVRYLRLYDPLVANDFYVSTNIGQPTAITLKGNIGNGGAITYSIETSPLHGTLSGTAPNLIYTPNANFFESDSFTYKVTYGRATSVGTVFLSQAACGSASGQTFDIAPTVNLCATGSVPSVLSTSASGWNWTCSMGSGPQANCSAGITTLALTFTAGAHGTLTGTTSQTINYGGSSTTVTANPDLYYKFVNWTYGSTVVGTNPALTVSNVAAARNYSANFEAIPTYTVTLSVGSSVTVSPATPVRVILGSSSEFTVSSTAGSGYGISASGCGGTLNGSSYTTGPVTADCTVSISAVARNADAAGSGQPSLLDAVKALQGYSGKLQLSAEEKIRYDVAPLGGNGVPAGNGVVDYADVILILRRSVGIGKW